MKTMFTLMNHPLNKEQKSDAKQNLKVNKFINISDDGWANISPSEISVKSSVSGYKKY
ncbi:hypothetical protein CCAL13119_07090 [Campylobacter sp. RM13119]|uniref:hypothetical protein n=1 Tax=Campylobacter californiensis TaxID=1032243 RepID=UPI001476684E|nr:hypothetical protein [Campylobacter sp. RM13119]MBE3606707.1 hypothetical protein [Campylobacter sp. RM13119]